MPGQIASLCKNYVGYPLPLGARSVIKSVSRQSETVHIHMLSFEILTLARLVSHMLTDPSPTRKIYLVLMNNSCSFRFLSLHFCEDDVIDKVIMFGSSSTDNCIFSKQNFSS